MKHVQQTTIRDPLPRPEGTVSSDDEECASYLRTVFLERVAHEIRSPAGVAVGAIDEIERALGPALTAELAVLLVMARRGLRRVLRVARRLQLTASLEAGRPGWAWGPVDICALVEIAVGTAQDLEPRRGVRLELSRPDGPCWVEADVAWLSEAIAEIVANAILHARTQVQVDTKIVAREVQVTIRDDGKGFSGPPPRRFIPPSSGRRGLGLSLPLALDVARAHRGRLELGPAAPSSEGGCVRLLLSLIDRPAPVTAPHE